MKRFFTNLLIIALVALTLQYAWEYYQCGIFYDVPLSDLQSHSRLMASATFGDVNMTVILYLLLAIVNRDYDWINKSWDLKEYVIIILYGLFLSFYFEASALYTGRWGYSSSMPFFPGTNIGLIPVLQLIILFPLTFAISRLIVGRIIVRCKGR